MMRSRQSFAALMALAGFAAAQGLTPPSLGFAPGPSYPSSTSKNGQRRTKRAAAKRRNQARNRRAHR